jgi:hypothetical protein
LSVDILATLFPQMTTLGRTAFDGPEEFAAVQALDFAAGSRVVIQRPLRRTFFDN